MAENWLLDSPADPYNSQGNGVTLADSVKAYWKANYQNVKRDLAYVMTSFISYGGGGYGYYNALCGGNGDYSYSASSVQEHTIYRLLHLLMMFILFHMK